MKFLTAHPCLTAAGTALLLRGVFVLFFLFSPFRFFHQIPGLDMETLLRFGEWGTPGNSFFFTVHRGIVFLFWKLNSGTHPVLWHVCLQSLLGACGAGMLAHIALKLFRKRSLALLAGILWALNPVELMYEFTTLQDALVNFGIVLSFWTFLQARQKRFRFPFAFGAGAAAALAATGRPVAVGLAAVLCFWTFYDLFRRHLPLTRFLFFGAGLLTVWLSFSAVNERVSGKFNCFFNPVPYALSVNTSSPQGAVSEVKPSTPSHPLLTTVSKMVLRTPRLWHPVEIPENLNIYFLRNVIPFFRLPFEFLPLFAAVGMILLITSGNWQKKEGLILLPILSLAVFLCIREPIGRYRLLLLPWFVLLTVWLITWCSTFKRRTAAAVLFCLFFGTTFFSPRPLRAADHAAWGWALEKEAGKITPEAMIHFKQAFQLKPDTNNAISLITRAMRTNDRAVAENTARQWMNSSGNSSLSLYYAALTAYPDHKAMKNFLSRVNTKELPPKLLFRYCLMQGDICRQNRQLDEAAQFYKSALQLPEGTPAQRQHIQTFILTRERKND